MADDPLNSPSAGLFSAGPVRKELARLKFSDILPRTALND